MAAALGGVWVVTCAAGACSVGVMTVGAAGGGAGKAATWVPLDTGAVDTVALGCVAGGNGVAVVAGSDCVPMLPDPIVVVVLLVEPETVVVGVVTPGTVGAGAGAEVEGSGAALIDPMGVAGGTASAVMPDWLEASVGL
ncbi:MAG TPA: hypothetical protein VMW18_02540, partial [Candidatus Binatia bacterium]|nr:hypothetical protein [Candidatus Binatia bacterium]